MKFIIYSLLIILNFLTASENYFQLEEFEDLELEALDYPKKNAHTSSQKKQKLFCFITRGI